MPYPGKSDKISCIAFVDLHFDPTLHETLRQATSADSGSNDDDFHHSYSRTGESVAIVRSIVVRLRAAAIVTAMIAAKIGPVPTCKRLVGAV
jgi:hypothetical protein